MMNFKKQKNTQGGFSIMFIALLLTIITVSVASTFVDPIVREFKNSRSVNRSNNAILFAETAGEDIYYRTVKGLTVPAQVEYILGNNVATATVTTVGPDRTVQVIGEQMEHIRKKELKMRSTIYETAFFYGAQIGGGGAKLDNNATIEGLAGADGDVRADGSIVGASGVTIKGNVTSASGIFIDDTASSTLCLSDRIVGKTDPQIVFAQSFVPATTTLVSSVELYIKKNGNPSSVDVHIVDDVSGSPADTPLSTGLLDRNKVSSLYAWVPVTFGDPTVLTKDQMYWIVLEAEQSNSKYWRWCEDTTAQYTAGSAKYIDDWDGSAWTSIAGDLAFKLFLGEGESLIKDVLVTGDAYADTIEGSTINGDAYYKTDIGSTVLGVRNTPSPSPAMFGMPLPDSVMDAWVLDATAGGTITGDCPGTAGCLDTMGPKKIDGNLSVGNGDTFTLNGTIYVTGNFTPENLSTIKCSAGYGIQTCILIVDGFVDVSNNATFAGSGFADSFIIIISRNSTCKGLPTAGCAPYNSAIYIKNNANGAIFYSSDGRTHISNGVIITSVIAHSLYVENTAKVQYDDALERLKFSSGPSVSWTIESWREIE